MKLWDFSGILQKGKILPAPIYTTSRLLEDNPQYEQ